MTWTDTGITIVISGKPMASAILGQPLQIVCHLLACRWRGDGSYQSVAVCLISTTSLLAGCRPMPYPAAACHVGLERSK
jgi:hypothetical protein